MHSPIAIAVASLTLAGCASASATSPLLESTSGNTAGAVACEVFFERQSMDLFDMPTERAALVREINQLIAAADADASVSRAGRMLNLPAGASRASWRSALDYFGARCVVSGLSSASG